MRICVLTHTLNPRTGVGVLTNNIIDGIRKVNQDINFSVLTSEDYIKPSVYEIIKNWRHIREEIKSSDIVHAIDTYPYGVIACIANFRASKPVIITAVGSGSVRMLEGFGWKSFLLRWAYRRADSLTAISNYVANEVKKTLPNLSIEVINPSVDYEFYSKEDNKKHPSALEGRYIITQGEFKERKGYEEILPIMKKIMAVSDVKYVIVGNTGQNREYQEKLYKIMKDLGIREKIFIRTNLSREELRALYKNAILYLTLPKNVKGDIEGYGMAIVEAAATGTPAVVGLGSGADDTVNDGESGFLIKGENSEEVKERILSIIDNSKLQEKLSIGAQNLAKGNSPENKAKKYIEIYERI